MASIERTVLSDHRAAYPDDFVPSKQLQETLSTDYFAGRVLNCYVTLLALVVVDLIIMRRAQRAAEFTFG